MNHKAHIPVFLEESINGLAIKKEGVYIDATFGRGGHSQAILEKLGPKGQLIAVDKDPEAVAYANIILKDDPRFVIVQGTFANLNAIASQYGIVGKVDGILLDLGISSPQLESQRGFSFLNEGPLDMRMDLNQRLNASQWINEAKEEEMVKVLFEFGEERFAKKIVKAIVKNRQLKPIQTTKELAEIVARVVPRERHKHPATRTFQAIRIYINQELTELKLCLQQCLEILNVHGRLAVISFHSLEDRIVKQFVHRYSQNYEDVGHPLVAPKKIKPLLGKIGRAIKPKSQEVFINPRARSAILRIAEKLP
jgi:16S rRNA (cytosine1402-N4)-methyltransferase